jgi:hypothetical protein
MPYPLVSALVLCYNQARFVAECLEGIRAQHYPNLEVLVNDDASRDGSAAVIRAWLERSGMPHQFLRSHANQGICRSLNNLLGQARGKYIAGIAADDVWLPGKLLAQVEMMERLPAKVGVVYSDALQMDETGQLLQQRFIKTYRSFEKMPEGNIHHVLWEGNFIPALATLIRRDCYQRVGLYDESLFYEDWDMWLRLARCFEFAYSEQISAKYRVVATSMMQSQSQRILDAVCQVCRKHLQGGSLDSEARRAAVRQLRRCAIASFTHRTPRHRRNLLQALRYGLCTGVATRLFLAAWGLGPNQFEWIRSVLRGAKWEGVS